MPPLPPRRRRARPVADAPIDGLLLRTSELAKAWLLALVEQSALQSAPLLVGAGVVDEGPQLCDAVLRALANDLELRRLEPDAPLGGLAARTGELAGAGGDPAATVQAVDALEGVLWAALREELRAPDPDLISDLAQRLGLVLGLLRVAALSREPGTRVPARPPDSATPRRQSKPAGPRRSPSADALWVGALEDELLRTGGLPLSLLLAEMEDAERVSATESAAAATAAFDHSPEPCGASCAHTTSSCVSQIAAPGSSPATRVAPTRRRWARGWPRRWGRARPGVEPR